MTGLVAIRRIYCYVYGLQLHELSLLCRHVGTYIQTTDCSHWIGDYDVTSQACLRRSSLKAAQLFFINLAAYARGARTVEDGGVAGGPGRPGLRSGRRGQDGAATLPCES